MVKTTVGKCPCPVQVPHRILYSGRTPLHEKSFFSVETGTMMLDKLIAEGVIAASDREALVAELQTTDLPLVEPTEEEKAIDSLTRDLSFVSASTLDGALAEVVSKEFITAAQALGVRERIALRTEEEKIADGIAIMLTCAFLDAADREGMVRLIDPSLLNRIEEGA